MLGSTGHPAAFSIKYELQPHWPALAWTGECTRGSRFVSVKHGPSVETADQWCCEAAWAGDFAAGDFDQTDIVVGSGIRVRDDRVVFVSAGSTVDRLQSLSLGDRVWVSNSLVALLAATGQSLDPAYREYPADFFSIVKGLDRYVRRIPCLTGEVDLTYFDNLSWDGATLRVVEKPNGDRPLATFADYLGFLNSSLARLVENSRDPHRRVRYTLLGTLSAGYDSPFATALMRPLGLEEVLCFRRPGTDQDDGTTVAPYLGVTPIVVPLDSWRSLEVPEVPFIAGDSIGEEVHYRSAEGALQRRLLVTGYHGDKVWDKDNPYTNSTLVRGDMSGTALTEYRLWAGFIHCPIAFFGARQAAAIKAISNSAEMRPWDVGGRYSRPICRRVVEQAGVPRGAFGMRKRYASRWFATQPDFLTPASSFRFLNWLGKQRGYLLRRAQLPPLRSRLLDRWRFAGLHALRALVIRLPGYQRYWRRRGPLVFIASLDMDSAPEMPPLFGFRRRVMPWAIEEAKRRYELAWSSDRAQAR